MQRDVQVLRYDLLYSIDSCTNVECVFYDNCTILKLQVLLNFKSTNQYG